MATTYRQPVGASLFIKAPEIMEMMGCSRSTASRVIKATNDRLKKQGRFVVSGMVNRAALMETLGYSVEIEGGSENG